MHTAAGKEALSQQKHNGNARHAQEKINDFHGEKAKILKPYGTLEENMDIFNLCSPNPSIKPLPINAHKMDSCTPLEMFGNGHKIGTIATATKKKNLPILSAPKQEHGKLFAEAPL